MPRIAFIIGTLLIMAALLGGGGCSRNRPAQADAVQVAGQYLQAFCRQDWPHAYAVLDPASRAQDSAEQYTQWVTDYRRRLGFDVETAVVVSCRWAGDAAAVEASLSGHAGPRMLKKEVVLTLHCDQGHWHVVLPASASGGLAQR